MKVINAILILVLLPVFSHAQIITTFAGPGENINDGVPATVAMIDDPGGMVFNKKGDLYIALGNGNRIRKIDTFGIITTIAGTGNGGYSGDNGPATSALLKFPSYVALDASENIFVVDAGNNVIRKIDVISGTISTVCGTGSSGYSGDNGPATASRLYGPSSICFDNAGNLYIADLNNNVIRKVNTAGIINTFAGTGVYGYNGDGIQATLAKLYLPTDVKSDNAGNIYICDNGNSRVRKVNPSGIISTYAGNGTVTYIGDGMPATDAQFDPSFIQFDLSQHLFMSDRNVNDLRVFMIDQDGIFHRVAGTDMFINNGDGGLASLASFHGPAGMAFDKCNNLYVGTIAAGGDSDRIRKITFNPYCWALSVQTNMVVNDIKIYPSPATDVLHIDGMVQSGQVYKIMSAVGNVLDQGKLRQGSNEVNISALADGMYMVEVSDSDGERKVVKIIKQ